MTIIESMKTNILFLTGLIFALMLAACWTLDREEPPCMTITGFAPSGAPYDSLVTVTGTNFCPGAPQLHEIRIGNTLVPTENITEVPDAQTLRFKVPKGIGNGRISVALRTAPLCDPVLSAGEFVYYYTVKSASSFAGTFNDPSCATCLSNPQGLDVNANGEVYVADRDHNMIQQIKSTPTGVSITPIAGRRDKPGDWLDDLSDGLFAQFNAPSDVALDNSNNIYVADEFNHRIRLIENSSRHGVSTVSGAEAAFVDMVPVANGRYVRPGNIATDGSKKLYVSEFTSHRVRELDLAIGGMVKTIATGSATPSPAMLNFPAGVDYYPALSADHPVLVADQGNKVIRGIGPSGLINITGFQSGQFSQIHSIDHNEKGDLFVTDRGHGQVFAVYSDKAVRALAGKGLHYTFSSLTGIAVDAGRNVIYVSDSGTHVVVRIELE